MTRLRARSPRILSTILLSAFAALLLVASPAFAVDPDCRLKAGIWSWFVNGDVTFRDDGTAVQIPPEPAHLPHGRLYAGPILGKWTCSHGLVTIIWNIGFTDRLVLTGNGRRLAGSNQDGAVVSGNWKRTAR